MGRQAHANDRRCRRPGREGATPPSGRRLSAVQVAGSACPTSGQCLPQVNPYACLCSRLSRACCTATATAEQHAADRPRSSVDPELKVVRVPLCEVDHLD